MADPLENKEFRHYLNFMSDDIGRLEITEPVKFDASEFVIEQDGYARHISFMNEEVSLEFYEVFTVKASEPYQLLNGTIANHLSHCLDYLLYYNKRYGFQSKVQYILERNGVEFVLGELNFEGSKTDELTYFFCKVVQNTDRATVIRREDTKIDAFSTKNIDGETITAIQTTNVLLKAKPETQLSSFRQPSIKTITSSSAGSAETLLYNYSNNITKGDVDDTLGFLVFDDFGDVAGTFGYVRALNDLTDVTIELKVDTSIQRLGNPSVDFDFGTVKLKYYIGETIGNDGSEASDVFSIDISDASTATQVTTPTGVEYFWYVDQTFNLSDLDIPSGHTLWIFYETTYRSVSAAATVINTLNELNIDIKATSTAIDTIVKATRYVDLIKQSLKSINGMTLNAPRFDEGGEFYNLFATTGNLIRQRDDVPFYIDFKDRRENLALVNGDIQINQTDAFALQYKDFYADVDNGSFSLATNESFESSYNSDYTVNLFEYKFKNYEKDRDESNTLDGVHTESQWIPNNDKVKATKKVEINDTFDPFAIQTQVSQVFKETTALDGDDKIFGLDCVALSPSSRGGFTSSMDHNINVEGNLQLLKNVNLPSWSLLGFNEGSNFVIVSGLNAGSYIVGDIENTIVTLIPSAAISGNGNSLTTVDYPLENVEWVNRTNEGFTIIENLLNPNNFGNLKYTIRLNMVHWENVLSTYAMYLNENIKNSQFKNNGLLRTQFGTDAIYTQNADIVLTDIKPPLVTPKEYDVDVVAEYDTVLTLISKYESITSVGGFVRVQDTNGRIKKLYPKKLGYTWATKVLNIIGEERYESDTVVVTKTGTTIFINRVGYAEELLNEIFYESSGDFIVLFDKNNVNLIDFTKYDKFIVQEETFGNPVDLIQAIIDL